MKTIETIRYTTAIILVLGLAGCSGGGGPGFANGNAAALSDKEPVEEARESKPVTIDIEGLEALGGEFTAIDRRFAGYKLQEIDAMRPYGTATFNGIAAFGPEASSGEIYAGNPKMLADLALTVDFGTSRVTGAMWDFHDSDGKVAGGSIALKGNQEGTDIWASGGSVLDWGDHEEELQVDINGYLLANNHGIKGTMETSSLFAGGAEPSTGIIMLKNDAVR